jgi:hypothetical protein
MRWFIIAALVTSPVFAVALAVFHKRRPTRILTPFSR